MLYDTARRTAWRWSSRASYSPSSVHEETSPAAIAPRIDQSPTCPTGAARNTFAMPRDQSPGASPDTLGSALVVSRLMCPVKSVSVRNELAPRAVWAMARSTQSAERRRLGVERGRNVFLDRHRRRCVTQHRALQVAKPPRHLAVAVPFVRRPARQAPARPQAERPRPPTVNSTPRVSRIRRSRWRFGCTRIGSR